MRVLFLYFEDGNVLYIDLPDEFCTPKTLIAIAIVYDCVYLTCTKYGGRQFLNPFKDEESKK